MNDDLHTKVFEDRAPPGAWRVEKRNEHGRYEVLVIFAGPHAHQNAIAFARQLDGAFDEPVG
jgi:hypothetical protein